MSDELRAAAERLLKLAEAASAGPWKLSVDVFDDGEDIQVCVQDDAINSLFCADSGIQPTVQASWADAKQTQTYRDGEFATAACTIGPQIARAYLAEHPEPPAITREGIEALRQAGGEIDVAAVREFRGEGPADDGEPVTAAWLEDQGFRRVDGPNWERWPFHVSHVQLDGGMRRIEWFIDRVGIAEPKTRGDVRRLCAALGVKLAGEQAKSASVK